MAIKNVNKSISYAVILMCLGLAIMPSLTTATTHSLTFSTRCSAGGMDDTNGTLSGYVTDIKNTAVPYARVRVSFQGTFSDAYSNRTGYYHVTDIPICNCTKSVTCSKIGYTPVTVTLSIDEHTMHSFVLVPTNYSMTIGNMTGRPARIIFTLTNTGPVDITTNITWTVYTFKIILAPKLIQQGTLHSLSKGTTVTLATSWFKDFGYGRVGILIEAECDNIIAEQKYGKAFALGHFIFAVKNM